MLTPQPALVPTVPYAKIPASSWPLAWPAVWTLLIVLAPGLSGTQFFDNPANYLPLHTGLEFLSLAVCAMVVALGWNLRASSRNSEAMIIGASFLYAGLALFAHTLSYKGMPDFVTPSGPEKAIYFWFAERLGGAFGITLLLFVSAEHWSRLRCYLTMSLAIIGAAATWWVGLCHDDWFPRTFIEGRGLTPFKIAAEYLFSAVYAGAGVIFFWRGKRDNSGTSMWLGAAAWTLALAGLFFTLYGAVTDIFNLLGHVYKTSAYWMIYRAFFASQVQAPVRALMEHEIWLERLVETRTRELKNVLGQFRIFVEEAPTAVAMLDRQMNYLATSRRWQERYGKSCGSLIGRNHYEVFPDLPEHWKTVHRAALGGHRQENSEELWVRRDGTQLWLSWMVYPWQDERGAIGGIIIAADDITKRKHAEAALRQEIQFSNDIINSLPGIFYMFDRSGRYARWNNRLCEVTGYRSDEVAQMQALDTFDPDTAAVLRERITEAFETGEASAEAMLPTRDGHHIPYYFTGRRTMIGGDPYVVGLGIDISDRKAAERKLIDQEAQFRQLSESLPQLVWTCDAGGACDYVSPQWVSYTGIPAAANLAGGWLDAVHPEDQAGPRAAWHAVQDGTKHYDLEFRLRRYDGTYRWFRNRAVPLTDSEGRILKWFGTSTDIDDLKQAQDASCLAMERLQTALKAASVTAFSQDQQLRYTWIYNSTLTDGSTKVLGKHDCDVLERAEDAVRIEAIKRVVMATGQGQRQEIALQRQGKEHHFELVVDPLRSREGDIIGVTCAALDITERKATELSVRRSEESLRLALSAARMSVFEYDLAAGQLTHRGPGSLELGLPESLAESQLFERIHPEDLPGFVLALKSGPTAWPVFSQECRFRMPNGSYRWIASQAKPHFDRDGHPVLLRGIYWDVTERKQTEHDLERHTQRQVMLRKIASSLLLNWYDRATLAHSVFDRIRSHLDADIGFYFRMDARRGDLELLASFGVDRADKERLGRLELGQGICGRVAASRKFLVLDSEHINRDEQSSLIRGLGIRAYTCHPLLATDGTLLGTFSIGSKQRSAFTVEEIDFLRTVAFFVALSLERLQAKMEVERLNAELERRVEERTAELAAINKELQGFTYAASHDMKGPLGRINSFSTLLERDYRDRLEGDGIMFLDFIRRNAQRLSALIEDLLSHAQIEHNLLDLEAVEVEAVMRQVLEEMEEDIRDMGAAVHLDFPPGLSSVQANHHGLVQVLRNLIGNAVKYSAGATLPRIEIGARIDGAICRIWVEDNGIGFDMVYHDKIFEIFRRLHTYDEYPGSGVGLAIARKAVERMQGKIWAESAPGQGATFFVEFPVAQEMPIQAAVSCHLQR
ncbi:MAG TPA: PAS domain S-box protein [Rhodocyclaceae bacterium]|nr:PAS domain S-box protein [Rhodocyclaceae bacterium]